MLTRLDLRGPDADPRVALEVASTPEDEPVELVREIIADVRRRGDVALRELTARFDGCEIDELRVPAAEAQAALAATDPELRAALKGAAARIRGYHEAQAAAQGPVRFDVDGVAVEEVLRPVDRAGLYVPGGRAAYPSTVLMTAIPAAVAGVPHVALCVPPDRDGRVPAVTLAAAAITGVDEVYRVGGAQAIAALAYGTESIPAVDVIVGPGNIFVSVAKREVAGAGVVGIESPAGPSELVVVADQHAPADFVASDLAAQAEHGPGGTAILVTWLEPVADAVDAALARIVADAPRRDEMETTLDGGGRIVLVRDARQAMDVASVLAPEHLEIVTEDPDALVPLVRNAGAVFLGAGAPTALGDYAAGANHVLPTGRSARFASALRVDDFRKHIHVVRATPEGSAKVSRVAAVIARAEGLDAHAHSLDLRADR
ncbi:MAG TPA: histidinol dehydrogenase [Acidimicrobiia bacterium]